ncbi:MAG: flagellar hook-length control protein FliK [Pseudomonadota bacterium]
MFETTTDLKIDVATPLPGAEGDGKSTGANVDFEALFATFDAVPPQVGDAKTPPLNVLPAPLLGDSQLDTHELPQVIAEDSLPAEQSTLRALPTAIDHDQVPVAAQSQVAPERAPVARDPRGLEAPIPPRLATAAPGTTEITSQNQRPVIASDPSDLGLPVETSASTHAIPASEDVRTSPQLSIKSVPTSDEQTPPIAPQKMAEGRPSNTRAIAAEEPFTVASEPLTGHSFLPSEAQKSAPFSETSAQPPTARLEKPLAITTSALAQTDKVLQAKDTAHQAPQTPNTKAEGTAQADLKTDRGLPAPESLKPPNLATHDKAEQTLRAEAAPRVELAPQPAMPNAVAEAPQPASKTLAIEPLNDVGQSKATVITVEDHLPQQLPPTEPGRSPAPAQQAPIETARTFVLGQEPPKLTIHRSNGALTVALEPAELGAISLEISRTDQTQITTLIVERPETLELLRRHPEMLRAALAAHDLPSDTLAFSLGGEQQGQNHARRSGDTPIVDDALFVEAVPNAESSRPSLHPTTPHGRVNLLV